MNAARIDKSERLQRVLFALVRHKRALTTRELIEKARVCAVNSCIAELRANGYDIQCNRRADTWYYSINRRPA